MNRRRATRIKTAGCQYGISVTNGGGVGRARRWGFSLTELMVVLAVAILLTGLLLPALTAIRENAHRIICASNERQQGMMLLMFASDHDDRLPYADPLRWENAMPQELMAAHHGSREEVVNDFHTWDGLGLLFQEGYCNACDIFYCPSHHGDHPYERYADAWAPGNAHAASFTDPVYMNYHYAGDIEWQGGARRNLADGNRLVLVADGLRTLRDFNHVVGMNVLRGDGSVQWEDNPADVTERLPLGTIEDPVELIGYDSLWELIQSLLD